MRTRVWLIAVSLFGVSAFVAPGAAHASLGYHEDFTVPSDGTVVGKIFPPGLYEVEVWGTYNFGAGLADAECTGPYAPASLDHILGPLEPHPISSWQSHRYDFEPTFGPPGSDPLDLYVNNNPTEWVPSTTAIDPQVTLNPSLGAGCNEKDHTYVTVLVSIGTVTTFLVDDPFPSDNVGVFHLSVSGLA